MAYDNVRVVGELGDIRDDQGFVHLNIEADFVVFSPKKGKKMVVCKYTGASRGIFLRKLPRLGLSLSKAVGWGLSRVVFRFIIVIYVGSFLACE